MLSVPKPWLISLIATTIKSKTKVKSSVFKLDLDTLDLIYMEKSKRKIDYIEELIDITRLRAEKLTVKQLRTLIARHASC